MGKGGGVGSKVMWERNSCKPSLGVLAECQTSRQGGTRGQVRHLVGEILSYLAFGKEMYFVFWLLYLNLQTIGLRFSLDGESGSSAEKARDDREEAYLQSNHCSHDDNGAQGCATCWSLGAGLRGNGERMRE